MLRRFFARPPAVSILMSVREGQFLEPAVETLLAQSFDDFELVLVDDASDRKTRAMIRRFRAADRRIVVLTNRTHLGLPAALNRGLAACRAPLVARADADDIYHPDRLQRQVAEMAARPTLGALSCGYHRIDAQGQRLFTYRPVTGPAIIRFRTLVTNSLLHPGAMFRTGMVRAIGGYDDRFWTAQDSDLWARLSAVAELDNLPDPLVEWRRHKKSTLRNRGDDGKALSYALSARLQSAYLGANVSAKMAERTVQTWRSTKALAPKTVLQGAEGLSGLLAIARTRESETVVTDFRRSTAKALLRQASWAKGPDQAAAFAALAAQWRRDLGDDEIADPIATGSPP